MPRQAGSCPSCPTLGVISSAPLAMNLWTIQLVVSPPFERPHQQGFIVHVEITQEGSELRSARVWKRNFQGMDWMQDPPIYEVREGTPEELPPASANAILQSVRSLRVCVAAAGDFGHIHPTKYQLTVQSCLNTCTIAWVDELPTEWCQLQPAVQALQAIGSAQAKNA